MLRFVAADGQAERKPAPSLIAVASGQGGAIVRLRLGLLADEIVGQPAIGSRSSRLVAPSRTALAKYRSAPRRRLWRRAAPIPAWGSELRGQTSSARPKKPAAACVSPSASAARPAPTSAVEALRAGARASGRCARAPLRASRRTASSARRQRPAAPIYCAAPATAQHTCAEYAAHTARRRKTLAMKPPCQSFRSLLKAVLAKGFNAARRGAQAVSRPARPLTPLTGCSAG